MPPLSVAASTMPPYTSARKVDVCVCTYRRRDELGRLLESLSRLELVRPVAIDLRVVVVDNDPDGPLSVSSPGALSVQVVHQPLRGIPYARNAGLMAARPDTDFVAFVDDDEVVSRGWLQSHLATMSAHELDVSTGPVRPVFAGQPPSWVVGNPMYYRLEHPEGHALTWGACTCNAVIRSCWIRPPQSLRFDESIGLGGGSDKVFFAQVLARGGSIGWSKEAVVHEHVPESRQTARWVFRRHERKGYERAQGALRQGDGARVRASLAWQAARSAAALSVQALGEATSGQKWRNTALRSGAVLGTAKAALGRRSHYYE